MNLQVLAPGSAAAVSARVSLACFLGLALCVLASSIPVRAQSGAMKGPREAKFSALNLKTEDLADRFVVLREQASPAAEQSQSQEQAKTSKSAKPRGLFPAVASSDSAFPGPEEVMDGPSPWPFFGGVFDEAGCRSPALAAGARVAAAICGGKGGRGPRTEYAVVREGVGIRLYRVPIAEDEGGLALSEDGSKLALVVAEDEIKVLHVIDLLSNRVTAVRGDWAEPRRPLLAQAAPVLAFEAQVGSARSVVRVDLGAKTAVQAVAGAGDASLFGLSDDGLRLLVTHKRIDFTELFLVDPGREILFDISDRSGEVRSAALHGGASQAVFSAEIGGACGLYWADLVIRRRSSELGSVEHCYDAVQVDRERRFVLYEQRQGRREPTLLLRDRRSRKSEAHMELPQGCDDSRLDPAGQYLAAFCREDPRGAGLFLVPIPQDRKK